MKKFNRVLAMLLALITALAVLPISVLADDWLNVDADKTTVENVTSTDITVTVDPKALLSYIQDGDVKGLLKGMSASGSLGDILTKAEILAILPEEQIVDLAKSIIGDIDAKELLACLDADKLLACVDTEGLISLLKDMDLKSYVKDIDILMNYIDKGDIEKAIDYIDTQKLIKDYSDELTELVMGLNADVLVDLIDDEKAIALFTDDELIDMALNGVIINATVLKEKLQAKLQNGTVTAEQIVSCIINYTAVVKEIGVDNAVSAIPGGYKTVINYVTDFKGLINTFDVKAIAKGILRDRVITDIIDAAGLIKAINVRAFVSKVDVKQLVKVIYESGVAQELLSQLDFESYLVQAFSIVASMQQTITEIKIDGVVITTQNEEGYLKLLPTRLIDSLENLVPTLNELANLDDSGKLFTASFAISYLDGEVEKTKEINFNFVLTAGTDTIRRAAAKLSALLEKIGYVGLTDGKLVAEVRIPSEFASVLRIALEKMADSTDPAMNALKDKVLAVYNAQPDDFIAFAEGLTLEEIVAVLEAVDPALFGEVYGKALTSRYAEVLLSYVERVTGYDFSDNLEAQNLVNTLATIPTFDVFVEKLENVTGIEITDRLPAKVNGYFDHTVYDVIEKLAEKAGYEFDLQNLLEQAAASTDPFAYLYTAVVNKVENANGVYNFVKRNTIRVANRLMATRVGDVIADNCLMDFYRGNSTFVFAKTVTFDARALVEKAFNKAVAVVGSRVSAVEAREDKLAEMFEMALDMILEDTAYMTTGFDVTVKANNIYRVTYTTGKGATILTTLLPAGTDLSKMVDYSATEGFNGWVDAETGEFITKMPAKDVVVKADVQGEVEYNVTINLYDENNTLVGTAVVGNIVDGTTLETYKADFDAAVVELYKDMKLPVEEALLGYVYTHTWDADFSLTVESDMVIDAKLSKAHDPNAAAIQVEGLQSIEFTADAVIVTIEKNWNSYEAGLTFKIFKAFLNAAAGKKLVLTSAVANAQTVTLSADLVAALGANDEVIFSYNKATNTFAQGSGAESYEFVLSGDGIDLGDTFDGDDVQIVLPFAGKATDDEKTFVYVDGEKGLKAGKGVTVDANTISFYAPHFSTITIVNKYRFVDDSKTYLQGSGEDIHQDGIASIKGLVVENANEPEAGYWFEAGATITATIETFVKSGYEYAETVIDGQKFGAGEFTFTMPAAAVTAKHYAKASIYNVYYYVNGKLDKTLEYSITDYAADKNAFAQTLASYVPQGFENKTGWDWFGKNSIVNNLGKNISLFWVNDTETKVTVGFYIGQELVTSYEKTIAQWRDGELAALKFNIDRKMIELGKPGYVWSYTTTDGDVALTDLTLNMLITSLGEIKFYGTPDDRNYHVFTDGNATADKTDAPAGTEITVTVTNKPGYTAAIKVYTTVDGTTPGDAVTVTDGKFTMPASNVIVTVEYTEAPITYNYITITVPAGSVLNATDLTTLASAPADMVLYKVERTADGALKLTYRYAGTFDEAAFRAEVEALITAAQYATTWIVNGVAYNSEVEAMNAELPEGAKIVGWTQMSQNVKVAIIEYTAPAGVSAWLIVCIVLFVLLLIALIALIYVLHVTDKIGASWLTKVCVAIVSVFFAFCMLLAKVTLKVLNFMGIKTEDILEELPEEEPVEDIPAVILDTEIATEEATEETAEEAVEEAAEETVEEAVEEAPVEEATEETAEEAVEEAPVEEATEETTEEVVEEEKKDE